MSEYRVEVPATRVRRAMGGALRRRVAHALAASGVVLLVAAGAYSPDARANVYEWKDSQNQIHYTDRPPPPGATLVSVRPSYIKRPTESSGSSGSSESPRTAAPRAPEAPNGQQQQQIKSQVAKDVQEKRAEQCKDAQERYKKYVESRTLYKQGENGERVYLSEQELEAARVNAKRELDATCAEAEPR